MPQSTVCLSFDFDALPVWFGFEQHEIKATFFVPGHTVDSFPHETESILEHGREIAHHSYAHVEIWQVELAWMDANVDGGVLTVTMHPQVIGRAHRTAMLEQFIAAGRELGVAFRALGDVAREL
ncbi:MAG TPA: polysaccharide deacetylase family protein [Gaiellaceae bacterium]|nr:polysaccharide deacetylase family protein [Gaiellaceae bacterium]